ncbi:unnamed protein product [Nippostrongylus brasiliensis]|uniref:Transposase n=1 Tax=Nippostrongylus brasiliensis TaxID=27835 RepID=A0A0N4YT61_NIPBR|nr:unnamed protein product [Nippostrongylus brasiliensis]
MRENITNIWKKKMIAIDATGSGEHDGNTLKDYKAVGVERVEISRSAASTPTERLKDGEDDEMPGKEEIALE